MWDKDFTNPDDPLGSLVLTDIGRLHPGDHFRGWVPLSPPADDDIDEGNAAKAPASVEGNAAKRTTLAGAVLLDVRLASGGFRRWGHFVAHYNPEPLPEPPLPPFDVNALYGPGMHLKDLVVDRLMLPMLWSFLHIFFWENWQQSFCILVAWCLGAQLFLQHWPTFFFLYLAYLPCASMSNPPVAGPSSEKKVPGDPQQGPLGSTDVQELSDTVVTEEKLLHWDMVAALVNRSCPAEQKNMLRVFQPLARLGADVAAQLHSIFSGSDPLSKPTVVFFVCLALCCELVSFQTQVMSFGAFILLVKSPLLTAVMGIIAYVQWWLDERRPREEREPPSEWGMVVVPDGEAGEREYEPRWSSKN